MIPRLTDRMLRTAHNDEFSSEIGLLAQWEQHHLQEMPSQHNSAQGDSQKNLTVDPGRVGVYAPTSGTIHTICCLPGDVIDDPDTVLVVLEAMKTEVAVVGGDEAVGRRVSDTVDIGRNVQAGETLVVLE